MSATIESLEIEIRSSATSAASSIQAISASLSKLKNAVKLDGVANQIQKLKTALAGIDSSSAAKIDKMANSLSKLSAIKISSSIGNQLNTVITAISSINGANFDGINRLVNALSPLSGIQNSKGLSSIIRQLQKLPQLSQIINNTNFNELRIQLQQLAQAFLPLNTIQNNKGLSSVILQLQRLPQISQAINNLNFNQLRIQLQQLSQAFLPLNAIQNSQGLSSIIMQLQKLPLLVQSINGMDFGNLGIQLRQLAQAFLPLNNIQRSAGLTSIINQLRKLPELSNILNNIDWSRITMRLMQLSQAFSPLNNIQSSSGLSSVINQLKKLPQIAQTLNTINWSQFTQQMRQLAQSISPLVNQLLLLSNAFSHLPVLMQRYLILLLNIISANNRASRSYIDLWAKVNMLIGGLRGGARIVASWINQSNSYIEDLNLFTISMGQYAEEAQKYAEQAASVMGIDPGKWMRNQGVFMTIAEGFGVASDRAYIMSKNLTQLGYDISSFANISYEDAMLKLQSGISGELEPLRRIGYDLSQARLQQEALNLGITKSFTAMTQAEKAQIRYYTIMKQVTTAQGDMARTLNAPANQLRVLRAELEQCARALGNIFLPALNAILPYAIAVVKVIRAIAEIIASLFHFELPAIDTSGISVGSSAMGDFADSANNAAGGLGGAAKAAKKLKNALLGIDELNIISPDDNANPSGGGSGAGGSGIGGGGGFDFPLPEYDFFKDAVDSKVNAIVEGMKEWLGLTGEINTWSDLFHTKLGRILTTIGAIGAGLLTWKLSKNFLSALEYLKNLKNLHLDKALLISIGISLAVTGVALEAAGIIDAIQNGLNNMNLAQIIGGSAFIVAGGALIGKALGDAILGGGIGAIIAGVPAFVTGIFTSLRDGISVQSATLTAFGATLIGAGIGSLFGPVGAGIGALIGLAVGLVTDGIILIQQHWDEIIPFLTNFFTVTLPGIWSNFKARVSVALTGIGQILSDLPNKITEWFHNIWNPIQEFDWYDVGFKIGELLGSAFDYIFNEFLPNLFTNGLPSLFDKVIAFIPIAVQWFLDMGVAIGNGLIEGLNTMLGGALDFFNGLMDGANQSLGDTSLADTIANTIQTAITKIGELAGKLLQSLPELIGKLFTVISETVRKIDWNAIGQTIGMLLGTALKLALGALKIIVTEVLPGVLKGILPFFANLPQNIWKAFTGAIKWIWDIGTAIIEGLIKGLGSIVDGVINFFKGIIDGVKEVFGIHSPSTVFMDIGKNLINGLVEGIKSLWDTIVTFFKEKLEGIKQVFANAWNAIKQTATTAWQGITTFLMNVWNNIKQVASTAWEGIKTCLSDVWNAIKDIAVTVFESIAQFVENTWENIKSTASKVWKAITTTLTKIWDTLKEKVVSVFDSIKEFISKVWDTIQSVTSNIWENITNFLSKTWETLKSKVSTLFNNIKEIISNVWNTIKSVTSSVWESIKSFLNSTWETLKTIVSTTFNAIKDTISTIWNTIKIVTSTVWESIKSFLSTLWENLKNTVSTVFNAIKDTISTIWNTTKTVTSTVWESIKSFLSTLWNNLKNTVSTVFNTIKDTISNIWDKVKTFTSDTWQNIKDKLSNIWDDIKQTVSDKFHDIKDKISNIWDDIIRAAKQWGKDIIGNLIDGINKKISDLKEAASGAAGAIKDFLHFSEPDVGPLSDFHTYMPDMMELMAKGIKSNSYMVLNTISDLTNSMSELFQQTPAMALAVDTGALDDYDTANLSRSVSANVQSNSEVTATGFKEAMTDFYQECLQSTMVQMSEDMKRQADKQEKTVVQVGNRTLMDAVVAQQKANGYQFIK